MKEVKSLKPFTRFLMTLGQLPSSYLVSMTYEEQLLWFCNFLQNQVIPTVNDNAEAVIELQNYVTNYFNNLNVQEEINNKLDEMALDGTLENIINQEIFGELNQKINNIEADVNELNKLKSNCKYHFLRLDEIKGDITILELNNKIIISDLSASTNINNLTNYFDSHNISKIDGIIISHYHGDHVGGANAEGFVALVNSQYVDENTQVYLPTDPDFTRFIDDETNVVTRIQTIKSAIISACEGNNITVNYMETGDEINIDNVILRFLNSDETNYDDYYDVTVNSNNEVTTHTNYNNFSMVTEIQNLNNTLLLTGDIEYAAETNLAKYLKRPISIKKIEHHGLNHLSESNYLLKSKAYYNICMQTNEVNDNFGKYETFAFNINNKNLNLLTETNGTMVFEDNGYFIKSSNQLINEIFTYSNGTAGAVATGDNTIKNIGEVSYRNLIKANDDLDDYTKSGDYVCSDTATANTLSNCPINSGFRMTVEYINNKDRILQTIIRNIRTIEIYYRYYDVNGWGEWLMTSPNKYGEAKRTSQLSLTGISDYTKIPLNNLSNGKYFELSEDGGLHPLASMKVLSGGFIILNGVEIDDEIDIAIFKNSTRIARYHIKANNINEQSLPIPQIMIDVTSSDNLYLYVKNATSGKCTVTVNNAFNVISL